MKETFNVRLERADWMRLKEIAQELGAVGASGALKGQPAVNALMRQIASGELKIVRVDRKAGGVEHSR